MTGELVHFEVTCLWSQILEIGVEPSYLWHPSISFQRSNSWGTKENILINKNSISRISTKEFDEFDEGDKSCKRETWLACGMKSVSLEE